MIVLPTSAVIVQSEETKQSKRHQKTLLEIAGQFFGHVLRESDHGTGAWSEQKMNRIPKKDLNKVKITQV